MNFKYVTINSGKPPVGAERSTRSKWRDLFERMAVGDWFELIDTDYHACQSAASKYMRGRYSLRKHRDTYGWYVFVKTR